MPNWSEINGRMTPGMDPWEPFRNFVNGLNQAGITQVPTNVQTQMAAAVGKVRDQLYREYQKGGGTLSSEEYFAPGKGMGAPLLRDAPMDVSIYAEQKVNLPYNGRKQTFPLGDLVPQLRQIRTAGDATTFVANSVIPAINKQFQFKEDFGEEYNEVYAAVAESVQTFSPHYQRGGKTHSRSLINHASSAVVAARTAFRRANQTIVGPSFIDEMGGQNAAASDPFSSAPVAPRDFAGRLDDVFGRVQSNERVIYGEYGVSETVRRFITADGQVQRVGRGGYLSTAGVRPGDYAPGLVGVLQPHRTDELGNPDYEYAGGSGNMFDVADQLESGAPATIDIMRRGADGTYRPMTLAGHGGFSPRQETGHVATTSGPLVSYVSGIQRRYRGSTDPMLNDMLANKMSLAERMTVKDPTIATNTKHVNARDFSYSALQRQIKRARQRMTNLYGEYQSLMESGAPEAQIADVNRRIHAGRGYLMTLERSSNPRNQRTAEDYWNGEDRLSVEELKRRNNTEQVIVDAQDYRYTPAGDAEPFPVLGVDETDTATRQVAHRARTGRNARVADLMTDEQASMNDQIFANAGNDFGYARPGTVRYEEMLLNHRLGQIKDPAKRAAIQWVGSAKKEAINDWAASVRQLNSQLNTKLPTDPQKFGDAFHQLELDDPLTADQFRGIIPTRAELAKRFSQARQRDAVVSQASVQAVASEPVLQPEAPVEAPVQPSGVRNTRSRFATDIRDQKLLPAPAQPLLLAEKAVSHTSPQPAPQPVPRRTPIANPTHIADGGTIHLGPSGIKRSLGYQYSGVVRTSYDVDFVDPVTGVINRASQSVGEYQDDNARSTRAWNAINRTPPTPQTSGGGGRSEPPEEPPDVAMAFDAENEEFEKREDYRDKVLHTTDAEGNDIRTPRKTAKRGSSTYRIEPNNPLNSILQFNEGYKRWETRRYQSGITTNSRKQYEGDIRARFRRLTTLPKNDQGRFIQDVEGFGFLEKQHQTQLLNALRQQVDPELADVPAFESAFADTSVDPAVRANETMIDRAQAAYRAARMEASPSRQGYRNRIRNEKYMSAVFNGGELPLFATGTETETLRRLSRTQGLRLDTVYGDINTNAIDNPRLAQNLPEGVDIDQVARGQAFGQEAIARATSGPLPTSPTNAVGTIFKRAQTSINEMVSKYIKELIAGGMDAPSAVDKGEVVKEIATSTVKAVKGLMGSVSDDFKEGAVTSNLGILKGRDVRTAAGHAAVLKNPTISEELARMGMTSEDLMKLKKDQALLIQGFSPSGQPVAYNLYGADDSGRPYSTELGEYNYQQRGRKTFAGQFGGALYGAYIAKRLWGMAAAPVMQQSEQYGNYMSSIGYLAGYGEENPDFLSTDAGFASRKAIGDKWLGQGANQQFGFFQTLPYYMSGAGEGLSRQFASAKTALGIGAVSSLAPMFMPGLSEGAAGLLSKAGWYAGAAVLGTSLALEGVNAIQHASGKLPEYEDITLSSTAQEAFVNSPIYSRAIKSYNAEVGRVSQELGITPMEASKVLGRPTSLTYESARDKWTTMEFTDEERAFLSQYMSAEDQIKSGVNLTSKQRKRLDRVRDLGKIAMEAGAGDDAAAGVNALFKVAGEDISDEFVRDMVQGALGSGRTLTGFISEASSYASSFGYLPGQAGFRDALSEFRGATTEEQRARMSFSDSRRNALGSTLQAQLGFDGSMAGVGASLVTKYNLSTQARTQGVSSLLAAGQAGGSVFNTMQADIIARASTNMGAYQSGIVANSFGNALTSLGASAGQYTSAIQAFSQLGLSNQDTANFAAVMNGDLGARSYMGWQSGNVGDIFRDQFNNAIWETNGLMGMRNMQANQGNLPAFQQRYGIIGNLNSRYGQTAAAQRLLGITDDRLVQAWINGGDRGMQQEQAQRSYEYSVASAGIQAAGIRLQQQFNWGSGSWDAPAAGSMWYMQDTQRSMQYASTMADFSSQWQRIQLNEQYAINQENLQQKRMNVSNTYNNWSQAFSYNQSLLQRQWAQEDWGYQDQMVSLNYGWQMEDMDLNIRYSSGRQRRQLIKQKERATLSHNLEGEQIETTRDRQKQTWALEDERYRKTREYTLELQKLDKQNFDLQKSHRIEMTDLEKSDYARKVSEFQESYELETKMIELQRKFQKEQLDLQMASAGVAAAAAESQRNYEIALTNSNNIQKDYIGEIGKLNTYKHAFLVASAMTTLAKTVDTTDVNKVHALKDLFDTVANIGTGGLLGLLLGSGDP